MLINSDKEQVLVTAGGKISCQRCQAMSKRTRNQCFAPAIKGKLVCRNHGGLSTGAKSAEGKQRAIAPHITYGNDTREMRKQRQLTMRVLRNFEDIGFTHDIFCGPKTPG
jgi:hypothetical protein